MMAHWLDLAQQHAFTLTITVPLIGAALASLALVRRLSWVIAVLAALAAAALAVSASAPAFWDGERVRAASPLIALAPDGIALFAVPVLACVAALVVFAAGGLLSGFSAGIAGLVLALALCIGAGWSGALLARDWVGVLLGVEIAWLASIGLVLVAGDRDRAALNGALRMLGAGGVAASLMVLGAGLVARAVGSADLAALDTARIAAPGLAAAGVALLLAGLAIKGAAAPLHLWAGAVMGRVDALTAWLIAALGLVGALSVLMRVAAHALAAPSLGGGVALGLAALGSLSVVIASMQAIGARNLIRLVAYAGAAQAGCIVMSMALGSQAGVAAALIQVLALAASALALLGGAAAAGGAHVMSALDGLGRRAPLAGMAVAVGALGLMGAPLTIAFLGRWRMIEAAVGVGWWWAACAAIAASLAGVFYGGRLIERVYFRRAATAHEGGGGWRIEFAPVLLAAMLVMAIGVEPSLLLRAANTAAAVMIGGAP